MARRSRLNTPLRARPCPVLTEGDIALAEYWRLKEEAQSRIAAQVTLVGFTLTAAAALSAVALSSGTTGSGGAPHRLLLLLIVPLVVNGLGMFFIQHNVVRSRIGAYCRDELWPRLGGKVGMEGFDAYLARTRTSRQRFFVAVMVASNVAIFTTSDVLALLLVRKLAFATSSFTLAVWTLDVVFSVLLIVAAAVSSAEFGQPLHAFLVPRRRPSAVELASSHRP